MKACKVFLCLFALVPVSWTNVSLLNQDNRRGENKCIPIEQIPLCSRIGYKHFTLPNFRDQYSAGEINKELEHFYPLISARCSAAMGYLLCAVYAPLCYERQVRNRVVADRLPPCRHLCVNASKECADTLKAYNTTWPPGPHLDCSSYPIFKTRRNLCLSPGPDLSVLTHLEVPTVKAPKTMACEAIHIEPTTATISMGSLPTTEIKDAALPAIKVDCNSTAMATAVNGTVYLNGLKPDTQHNCTIQRYETDETYICQLQFRTPRVLDIEVINDTPKVTDGTIKLDFRTNRMASKMECQLLTQDQKLDCSSGSVEFANIEADYYTIRIVARNSETDRATLRLRVRVPDTPNHCVVNLLNRQWKVSVSRTAMETVNQHVTANVTVWFKALGPEGTYINCCLDGDKQCEINCLSPFHLRQLIIGENKPRKLRLVPKGPNCNSRTSRTIKIELPS